MNHHKTTVHARCPYAPVWDYYELTFETCDFLQCETLQDVCNAVRGQELTQEDVFAFVANRLPVPGKLTVAGMHGANSGLVICESVPSVHRCK